MYGFRWAASAQRFVASQSTVYNTFNICRHLTTASTHRFLRELAFDAWRVAVAVIA